MRVTHTRHLAEYRGLAIKLTLLGLNLGDPRLHLLVARTTEIFGKAGG
jgi:hypothetical protein